MYWSLYLTLNAVHKKQVQCGTNAAKVHFMLLGPKTSSLGLAFLSAWCCGYKLECSLFHTVVVRCRSWSIVFLPTYARVECWGTPEELLAYIQCELHMECTLMILKGHVLYSIGVRKVALILCHSS